MGPRVFERMLHDIQDPETRQKEFRMGPDAMGERGASALQKIAAVIRMLSYGVCFDAIEEYTGMTRTVVRDCLHGFCDWLDEAHGGTYLGVWTPEAIVAEMEISVDFMGCSVALIAPTGSGKTALCHGRDNFRIEMDTGRLLRRR